MYLQNVILKKLLVSVILCVYIASCGATPIQRNGPQRMQMTEKSHPMLSSLFNTANNVRMIDFTNKHVGVKRSRNGVKQGEIPASSVSKRLHRIGPNSFLQIAAESRIKKGSKQTIKDISSDSSKSIIAGTANAICQYCRTILNTTCIQIYCFNDAAAAKGILVEPNIPSKTPLNTFQIAKSETILPQEIGRPIGFGEPFSAQKVGSPKEQKPVAIINDVSSQNLDILGVRAPGRHILRGPSVVDNNGQTRGNFPKGFDLNHVEFIPLSELSNAPQGVKNTELPIHHAVPVFQDDVTLTGQSHPHRSDNTVATAFHTHLQQPSESIKSQTPSVHQHVVPENTVPHETHPHFGHLGTIKHQTQTADKHPQEMVRVEQGPNNPHIPSNQQTVPLSEIVLSGGESLHPGHDSQKATIINEGNLFELPALETPIKNTALHAHHNIPSTSHSTNTGLESTQISSTDNAFHSFLDNNVHSSLQNGNVGQHHTEVSSSRSAFESTSELIPLEILPEIPAQPSEPTLDQLPPIELVQLEALLPLEIQPGEGVVNTRPSDSLFNSPNSQQKNNNAVVIPGARPFDNLNLLTGNDNSRQVPKIGINQITLTESTRDTTSLQDPSHSTNERVGRSNTVQIPSAQTFHVLKPHLGNQAAHFGAGNNEAFHQEPNTIQIVEENTNVVQVPPAQGFSGLKPHLHKPQIGSDPRNNDIPPRIVQNKQAIQIAPAQGFKSLKTHTSQTRSLHNNPQAKIRNKDGRSSSVGVVKTLNGQFINGDGGLMKSFSELYRRLPSSKRVKNVIGPETKPHSEQQNTQRSDIRVDSPRTTHMKTVKGQFMNGQGKHIKSFSELYRIRPKAKSTNSQKSNKSLQALASGFQSQHGVMNVRNTNIGQIRSSTLAPSTATIVTMNPARKAQLNGMSKTLLSNVAPFV